jgi:hypothetical protein
MKKLLIALLLAVPLAAPAEKIAIRQDANGHYIGYFSRMSGLETGGTGVYLTLIPCPMAQYADRRVAAEYVNGARARRGCWKADAQGKGGVMIYYTNGTTERDWLDRYHYVDQVPIL